MMKLVGKLKCWLGVHDERTSGEIEDRRWIRLKLTCARCGVVLGEYGDPR